jgi:hypothetical protein
LLFIYHPIKPIIGSGIVNIFPRASIPHIGVTAACIAIPLSILPMLKNTYSLPVVIILVIRPVDRYIAYGILFLVVPAFNKSRLGMCLQKAKGQTQYPDEYNFFHGFFKPNFR